MTDMTIAEIDAELADLRAAEKDFLLGRRKTEVSYGDTSVQFGGDFYSVLESIRTRITELTLARSRITGEASGLGPFRPGFGCRP